MDKPTNITKARSTIERTVETNRAHAIDRSRTRALRGPRGVGRRAFSAASTAIDRLVVIDGSSEGTPALEKRAKLLANDMRLSGDVVTLERKDDVSAMTSASDLVLVDRKRPVPFVVPYLGRAERRLLRKSHAPMLVVAGMPEASYRRVVVATDLQTDLSDALNVARSIAPNASFTLLHVYRAPFDGKLRWAGVSEIDMAEYRVDAQREAALGMAALVDRHDATDASRALLRYGWPVPGVLSTSAELDADLIVVVRNTRSWWADALGASNSLELAERANCDVLVVHPPVSNAQARSERTGRRMQ
jgi:nucleotide-binding universal stress UspA family protein